MILTFSKQQFVDRILDGTKIHTIREDKTRRWKPGMRIQFWKGNPRNKRNDPYQFTFGRCLNVESITLDFSNDTVLFTDKTIIQDYKALDQFAVNDGFDNWDYMKYWFYDTYKGTNTVFQMRLIHFDLQ